MTEELVFELENDVPTPTYNGPLLEDGEQPTREELAALLERVIVELEEDDDE